MESLIFVFTFMIIIPILAFILTIISTIAVWIAVGIVAGCCYIMSMILSTPMIITSMIFYAFRKSRYPCVVIKGYHKGDVGLIIKSKKTMFGNYVYVVRDRYNEDRVYDESTIRIYKNKFKTIDDARQVLCQH